MDNKTIDVNRIEPISNHNTEWATTQHFTQNGQPIEDVHIIVPDTQCIQDNGNLQEKLCIQNESVMRDVHEPITTEIHQSGDSLAALADAAELDQCCPESPREEERLNSLPLAPFLKYTDAEATFYNEIYHYISSKTFPSKSSDYHKRIIKKRATNYMITEEGRLAYGTKNPKKVVTDLEEQLYLIKNCHIEEESGSHVDVKRMQSNLSSNFHWRSMANDINYFIKNCDQCCKSFVHCKSQHSEELDGLANTELSLIPGPSIWKKIALFVHGPYKTTRKESKFVVSVSDNFSKWTCATALQEDDIERGCADFLFDCFCSFGFTQSEVLDTGIAKVDRINWLFQEKMKILSTLNKNDINLILSSKTKSEKYAWIENLINGFCETEDDNWDESLNAKLFQHNTSCTDKRSPPFYMMFSRSHFSAVNGEEKENSYNDESYENAAVRRRLRSSTLQCRHCCETFTSKISFRIHQRRHTEDARRRGILDGEENLCALSEGKDVPPKIKKRRKSIGANRILTIANSEWSDGENKMIPSVMRSHLTQSTVEAVRNLLHATKEERNKRGKYFKYTPELRDQIAQYAMDHSIPAASLYWSDRLCSTVSESSIRNFMKAYKCFSASIKEEIGKYAFHNGIERAAVDYSEKLGFEVRKGIILKFKKLYTRKVCEGNAPNQGASSTKKSAPCRQKRAFSFLMKEEIGRYAHSHGISAAIDHFSVKLQFSVKESTVRKFKRRYQERTSCASEQINHHEQCISAQELRTSPSVDVLHTSLPSNCSNPSVSAGPTNTPNSFIYQHSYPINMTPGAGMHHNGSATVLPMNHNIAFHQGGVINQGVAALSYQPSPGTPTVIMNQSFASVAPSSFQQSCINNFNQIGPSIAGSQGQPITIAHASLTPTMSHANAPLQLTMGGQLTPVPVSHSHLLNHGPNPHHPHHPGQQIITPTFSNQLTSSLPFDQSVQTANHPTIHFTNEPINLLKEASCCMPVINHVCSISNTNHIQESAINAADNVSSMPTPIVQLTANNLTQMEPSENHSSHTPGVSNQRSINVAGKCIEDEYLDEEMASLSEDEYSDSSTSPKKKHRARKTTAVKFTYACSKRGNYVSYTPELRAQIGKYAAEHANLDAIAHFKEVFGLDIPESTVRGLKDKYIIKRIRGEKDVKSLGFGQRGRPMRLGKYDAVVQDCIRQLVKEGEKISSFLVIATAKQVLTQNEPSLLEENGGPVTLNPTWAKSFLKRIGIHQS